MIHDAGQEVGRWLIVLDLLFMVLLGASLRGVLGEVGFDTEATAVIEDTERSLCILCVCGGEHLHTVVE